MQNVDGRWRSDWLDGSGSNREPPCQRKGLKIHQGVITHEICCLALQWLSLLDAVTSSGILKAKQKLGRTFNSDKLGGIAFTKISTLTMCSA